MADLCPRCRDEMVWDEGPLCEDCFNEVEMGRALRGDYGPAEQVSAVESVEVGIYWPDLSTTSLRHRRALIRLANAWASL